MTLKADPLAFDLLFTDHTMPKITGPIGRGDRRLPAHFDGLIRSLPDP